MVNNSLKFIDPTGRHPGWLKWLDDWMREVNRQLGIPQPPDPNNPFPPDVPADKPALGGIIVDKPPGLSMGDGAPEVIEDLVEDMLKQEGIDLLWALVTSGSGDGFKEDITKLFHNRTPKASELEEYGDSQVAAPKKGWTVSQNPKGPKIYRDKHGVKRLVIKRGSPRTPGSQHPRVEVRDAIGQQINPRTGDPVTQRSPGNHIAIDWDLD